MVAALQVLRALIDRQCTLGELCAGMAKLPQVMINVAVERGRLDVAPKELDAAVAEVEARLASRGRVLLRPSGTEPVVRVMVEGEDAALVQELAVELAGVVARQVG